MKFVFVITLFVSVGVFETQSLEIRGLPNVNCRDIRDPKAKVVVECNADCINQHGTEGGQCGDPNIGDYNCYCNTLTDNVNPKSAQCNKRSEQVERFCGLDCVCNHGATGGRCDFERKACICHGYNLKNVKLCPFENSGQFVKQYYQLMKPKSGRNFS